MQHRVVAASIGAALILLLCVPRCTPQIPLPPPGESPAAAASGDPDAGPPLGSSPEAGTADGAQAPPLDSSAPEAGLTVPPVGPPVGGTAAPPGARPTAPGR